MFLNNNCILYRLYENVLFLFLMYSLYKLRNFQIKSSGLFSFHVTKARRSVSNAPHSVWLGR